MPNKIQWVRRDVVEIIQCAQIREHGGHYGIRDDNLLESALHRPIHQLEYRKKGEITIPILATYYAIGIIKNHPFIDGNKRTALVVSELFLKKNDFYLKPSIDKELIILFYGLSEGLIAEKDFQKRFIALCIHN